MSVSDEVALAEGEQAADRIISGGRMIDYLEVARALKVGQRIAIREAGTDQGKPYNIAFSHWLDQHPRLRTVNKPDRAAALWCLDPENYSRVMKHLAALDADERQRTTLRTVRRRLDVPPPSPPTPKPPPVVKSKPAAVTRPDRVQEAADRAEIMTLKAEIATLKAQAATPKAAPQSEHVKSATPTTPVDDAPIDHDAPWEPEAPYPAKAVPNPDGGEAYSDGYNPLDPYDYGSYSENLWQTVLRAGLTTNYRDTKLFIHDRGEAVAWFEAALAALDVKPQA